MSEGRIHTLHISTTTKVCFSSLKHLIYCACWDLWATPKDIEPLYTRVYLMLKSERDCNFWKPLGEKERSILYDVLIHTIFMQCKSYSKSITASNWKKPLCFPCCMLLHKTNLFYLLLAMAYLWAGTLWSTF